MFIKLMPSVLGAMASPIVATYFFLSIASSPVIGQEPNFLAPQSTQAIGEKRLLMVAVRFPDAQPSQNLNGIRKRAVGGLNSYVKEQSYGQASIAADFKGWVTLPEPLSAYQVSPYNFKVDRGRVRKLVEDTMSAVESTVDFSRYQHMLVIPGVQTMPGKGYGMLCYCANPGMLSGVSRRYVPRYETLRARSGKEFSGGVFMGAENAHLGMFAHDYFHALGGIHEGKRLAPCLYDYRRQSDESHGFPSGEIAFAAGETSKPRRLSGRSTTCLTGRAVAKVSAADPRGADSGQP